MSSYVDKDYFYYLRGRELLLYKLLGSRNSDRITQNGVLQSYDNELVYPDEDIANDIIHISESFNVAAQIIGKVESYEGKKLTIDSDYGKFTY